LSSIDRTRFIEDELKKGSRPATVASAVAKRFGVKKSSAGYYVWVVQRELAGRSVRKSKEGQSRPKKNRLETLVKANFVLSKSGLYAPYDYQNEGELEKLVEANSKRVFGSTSFYFPLKWKVKSPVRARIIDGLLLSFESPKRPKASLIEFELMEHDLQHIENQLRDFHRALQDKSTLSDLTAKVYSELRNSNEKLDRVRSIAGSDVDLHALIDDALHTNCSILLILDTLSADFEHSEALGKALEDIAKVRDVDAMEFKTFVKNGEFVHYCNNFKLYPD
jgi:hypothetical protein